MCSHLKHVRHTVSKNPECFRFASVEEKHCLQLDIKWILGMLH